MNNELFNRANAQYQQRDFQGALIGFTDCLQDASAPLAPGEMGLLYHRIGNCLVKLKNPAEAIQAYTQATADAAYGALGTVECNLGMAYASLRDYENAVGRFEAAVADDGYDTPFKAYMGMGNALMKLGKSAEAGVAFREAALDEANPDPTRALLNLGVCFMALNRPADAVASYESALQFDMAPDTRNKLLASLGQAHVACGQMEKAVEAFEGAIADKTYFLSDSASVDYQRAVGAVAQGTSELTQVLDLADISGLDVSADGDPLYEDDYAADPFYYDEGYDQNAGAYPGYVGAYQGDEDRFFNASEEELEQWSRGLAKQDRKRRNVGLKILVALIVVIVLAFAGAVFAYSQGYGFPTQETVAKQLFADPEAAKASLFANMDEVDIDSMLDPVVTDADATVDGVNRSMSDSEVFVTASTEQGGDVTYRLSMVRDMIGWKISNVELYFPSQN
ncbi:tetratricopeptide repeat protein [Adlercreutzia sp. ZJ242]|uniref:tetratricopeptide repeat protein n=1 Tax=Adlercreutzia sp. ZJ242 TaxID=2709409 RepID=UPI0013ED3ED8|nr:tetratricopeptide repeat protein [Adlercreutzia sp. ZJ242]